MSTNYSNETANVLEDTKHNKHRNYTYSDFDDYSAGARFLRSDFVSVSIKPKFKITESDKIFTMGSCFARNIEKSLQKNGVSIVNNGFNGVADFVDKNHGGFKKFSKTKTTSEITQIIANSGINKYHPASMLDELKRIQSGKQAYLEDTSEIPYGKKFYFPLVKNLILNDAQSLATVKNSLWNYFSSIRDSTVVIYTLGYIEAWYDAHTGKSLNITPPPILLKRQPDRFYFKKLRTDECLSQLNQIVQATNQLTKNHIKIIFTVSPVPLGTTFSGRDAISANTYSKSVLRATVEEVVNQHNHVDYFPSFEIVNSCDRTKAFQDDMIHVKYDLIDHVMNQFMRHYLE